jgi:serine/threonine protein kinase
MEVYEEENLIYLLFENYLGKDIRNRLCDYSILQEKMLAETMYKLLLGLNSLHQRGIVHRDIKPESIIVRNDNNLTDLCISNLSCADVRSQ